MTDFFPRVGALAGEAFFATPGEGLAAADLAGADLGAADLAVVAFAVADFAPVDFAPVDFAPPGFAAAGLAAVFLVREVPLEVTMTFPLRNLHQVKIPSFPAC